MKKTNVHNVLIVDDTPYLLGDLREVCENVLRGWNILTAVDYQDAFDIIQNNRIDLLLTDIVLNEHTESIWNGVELSKLVYNRNQKAGIIAVSSHLDTLLKSVNFLTSNFQYVDFIDRNSKSYFSLLEIQLRRHFQLNAVKSGINSMWDYNNNKNKYSYWILLTNGFDIGTEKEFSNELLFWNYTQNNGESEVAVLNPSSYFFNVVVSKSGIDTFPALILSSDICLEDFVVFRDKILAKFSEDISYMRKFFVKMHIQLKNGVEISSIKKKVQVEDFWDWISWSINEFQSIVRLIK